MCHQHWAVCVTGQQCMGACQASTGDDSCYGITLANSSAPSKANSSAACFCQGLPAWLQVLSFKCGAHRCQLRRKLCMLKTGQSRRFEAS